MNRRVHDSFIFSSVSFLNGLTESSGLRIKMRIANLQIEVLIAFRTYA